MKDAREAPPAEPRGAASEHTPVASHVARSLGRIVHENRRFGGAE